MHLNACAVTCTETIRSKTSEYNRFRFAFGDHFRLVLFPPSSLTLFPNRTVFPWYSPLFARPHTTSRFWSFAPSCFDACFDDIICVCLCVCVCVCMSSFFLSLSDALFAFLTQNEETKKAKEADFSLFFCFLSRGGGGEVALPSPPLQEDKIISSRSSLPECRPSVPPPVVRKMARACTQREREKEREKTGREKKPSLEGFGVSLN